MTIAARLTTARQRYVERRPRSAALAAEARTVLPGGNTRSVLDFDPFPFRVQRVDGVELVDVDGLRYVDLLGNYTAGLLGHRPEAVRQALVQVLDDGWVRGAVAGNEAELARLICGRFPGIDQVRFTNSGTEANLMALAAAVAYTDRRGVLAFRGGYHGGVLSFASPGSPLIVPHDFVLADYNDTGSVAAAFAARPEGLAAVLVEPMMGASGCLPAEPGFLADLRSRCDETGALLIFDEVMTSRLSPGGAQLLLGITPDLTTLGKYLGGGMSFGAFGGRHDVMAQFDPRAGGALSHGGTFNNNELTMAAGVAALSQVLTSDALAQTNARGERLRSQLDATFAAAGLAMCATGWGSLLNIHAVAPTVVRLSDRDGADDALLELLFLDLLDQPDRGWYMARRGLIALSIDISDEDLADFVAVVDDWASGVADPC